MGKKKDYDVSTAEGQKRLMRESANQVWLDGSKVKFDSSKDHGADPLGNGKFRMIPSGDIVELEERNKRLKKV